MEEGAPLGRRAIAAALCAAGVLVGPGPAALRAEAAEARLVVTARVVNRCTIELPPSLPPPARGRPPEWRGAVRHSCDHPVDPRLSLERVTGPAVPHAVGLSGRDGHYVVTITY